MRKARVWGHFGEILQGRLGPSGAVALLTLSAPGVARLSATARWRPARNAPLLTGGSALSAFSAQALRSGLRETRRLGWGGSLDVQTCARPGGGCGVSTSSLLSALRVSAPGLSAEREAAILLELEGAVDPLMLPSPGRALWASREGRILRDLPPPPRFLVVGGYDGPGLRTDPTENDFLDIRDLAERADRAARAGDRAAFAAVATASAQRRQTAAPKPSFNSVIAIAQDCAASGVVVAHTGSAIGLLFAPCQTREARRAEASLARIGVERLSVFLSG